jgi:hypothetical protein
LENSANKIFIGYTCKIKFYFFSTISPYIFTPSSSTVLFFFPLVPGKMPKKKEWSLQVRSEVVALRKAGNTWEAIKAATGVPCSKAHQIFARASAGIMHTPKIPIFRSLFLLMSCLPTCGVQRLLLVEGALPEFYTLSLI